MFCKNSLCGQYNFTMINGDTLLQEIQNTKTIWPMMGCKYFQWCHIHLGRTNRKQHYFEWASTRYFTIQKPVKLQKNNLFFWERSMYTGVATAACNTMRKTWGNMHHWHEVQVKKSKFVQNAHFTRIYIKSQKINRKSKITQNTTILSKRRKGYMYQSGFL